MVMAKLCDTCVFLVLLCVFANLAQSVKYSDLETMGIACPPRDKCSGNSNNRLFTERNCECDSACHAYQDCCVDVRKRSSAQAVRNVMCLHYGEEPLSGIYAVSKCSNRWNGPEEVKRKCEGSTDFSDPITAAPVTSPTASVTYKNLYCAQCNNADMDSLKMFAFNLSCEGLKELSQEQIMDQMSYDKQKNAWGVNRNSDFKACEMLFQLPSYLERHVRLCRANIVANCAKDWTRRQVKKSCEEYTAVVYSGGRAFRNPHCAQCNHLTISKLSCLPEGFGKKQPLPLSVLIDINDRGHSSSCPDKSLFDPYLKRCRKLACALPGYVIKDNQCVPGG